MSRDTIRPTYEFGYLHGRNGDSPAAQGEAYQRGYRDGQAARAARK